MIHGHASCEDGSHISLMWLCEQCGAKEAAYEEKIRSDALEEAIKIIGETETDDYGSIENLGDKVKAGRHLDAIISAIRASIERGKEERNG